MPTDKKETVTPENPLRVIFNERHAVHFDDIEFQRRFEQNLIRYKLGGETIIKEVRVGGGNAFPSVTDEQDCYWTLEGMDIIRYGGNVGIGIHPIANDFEVLGNVLIEAKVEQPYLEIRNWSATAYDPVIHWSLGATPVKKYTMGVDDSDSDAWLLCSGDILSSLVTPAVTGGIIYTYDGTILIEGGDNYLKLMRVSDGAFLDEIGGSGTGDGQFDTIRGICNDGTYAYVVEQGNDRLQKIRISDMTFVAKIGSLGSGNDQFNNPWKICSDGTYLYIVDSGNSRVVKRLCSDLSYDSKSSGTLNNPSNIAIDGTYLFVSQNSGAANRLVLMSAGNLSFLGAMANDGHIDSCTITEAIYKNGYLWLCNANVPGSLKTVYKYQVSLVAPYFAYVTHFLVGNSLVADEFYVGWSLDLDDTQIYLFNTRNAPGDPQEIYITTLSGTFVRRWGQYGTHDIDFVASIAISLVGTISGRAGTLTYTGELGISMNGISGSGLNRVKTHLSNDTLAYVSHFHLPSGTGDNEANQLVGICSDGLYYYVVDRSNHRVKKHRISDGLFMWAVGGPLPNGGSGNDEFDHPWGICTDGTYIYVADGDNYRVKKHLCSTGAYVAKQGSNGGGTGQWAQPPRGICTDGTYVWVTSDYPLIQQLQCSNLSYVNRLAGSDGHLSGSTTNLDLCVTGGYLYILNSNSSGAAVIFKYNKTTLVYVSEYGTHGSGDGQFNNPYGIDTNGTHLYIGDTSNARIKKHLVSDMSYVSKFGTSGTGDNEFEVIYGICVNVTTSYLVTAGSFPILKAGLDGSYCDSYPLFRARDGFQLMEDGTVGATDYVGLYAPAAITASYSLTFPGTGPAAVGHFAIDSAGAITWGQNVSPTGYPSFNHLHLTVVTGTAPLDITSTTVCPNLNADLLDGSHAVSFAAASHTHNANEVLIPSGLGTPTYDDTQDFLNMTQASGRLTGGVLSAHAGPDGTLDISAMEGMVHTANTLGSPLIYFKRAAVTSLALNDNAVSYIWCTYSTTGGGTITYSANAARPTEDYNVFVIGRVWRSGNTVEVVSSGQNIYNQYGRMQDRLLTKYGNMDHASGSIVSAHATPLQLDLTAGVWYFGNTQITTLAQTTFHVWYRTGGSATWVESAAMTLFSDIFNGAAAKTYEVYQNGTSLVNLANYGVYWLFVCPAGDLYVVLGIQNYTNVGNAQAAVVPPSASLPPYCINWARLVGRVICQKSGAALYSVESSFSTQFTLSAAVDHASLANLAVGDPHTQYCYVKIDATATPGVDDDITYYREGTIWIEQDADKAYVLVDNANGAAVWKELGAAGGALALDDLTDVDAAAPSDHDIIQYHTGIGWVHGALPAGANHDVLDGSTHGDTLAGAVSRGSLIYGNSTPKWAELVKGNAGDVLTCGADDVAWAAPGGASHVLLSATHTDTLADTVVRGDIIYGNATPKWARLAKGTSGYVLTMGANEPGWAAPAAGGGGDFLVCQVFS